MKAPTRHILSFALGMLVVLRMMGQCPYQVPAPAQVTPLCPIDLVQIQGWVPNGNGLLRTQIWVGNDAVADTGIVQSTFLMAFDSMDIHGLPLHHNPVPSTTISWPMVGINYYDSSYFLSSAIQYAWPVCQGNCNGGIGNEKGAEQAQQDGWLLLPDSIPCIRFSFSGVTNKSAALYLSVDGTVGGLSMELGCLVPGSGPLSTDWQVPLGLPVTNSGFRYTRIRLYHHDAQGLADTEVRWDIGNGLEPIPAAFFQSVASPQSGANPPSGVREGSSRFAYRDSVGNLFSRGSNHLIGGRIGLDVRYKEMDSLVVSGVHSGSACDTAACDLYRIVKVLRYMPDATGEVYQQKWTGSNAYASGTVGQQSYLEAFFNSSGGLPAHPTANIGSVVQIPPTAAFGLKLPNNIGTFQATQDAWLAIPPHVSSLSFKLGTYDSTAASGLWLGEDVNGLRLIAEEVGGLQTGGSFALPYGLAVAAHGWRWVRARLYVHDDGGAHNSLVQWDLGQGFEDIANTYVVPCDSARDAVPPPAADLLFAVSTLEYGIQLSDGSVWEPNGNLPLAVAVLLRDSLNRFVVLDTLDSCGNAASPMGGGADCATAFAADPCNANPIAVDDTIIVIQNIPMAFNPRTNDRDPNDIHLSIVAIGQTPIQGVAVQIDSVTIRYSPSINFSGSDFMTYVICDDGSPALCATGNIYIRVLKDIDFDQVADTFDLDNDNDGIPDAVELRAARNGGDTDHDGYADVNDLDADNDGIPDLVEYGWNDTTLVDGHAPLDNFGKLLNDHDVIPNGWDDYAQLQLVPKLNSDSDTIPDFQDLDSDNDGIYDIVERGFSDTLVGGCFALPLHDNDHNGWQDGAQSVDDYDFDGDTIMDRLDLDSDNDGIPNVVEAGQADQDEDGMLDSLVDVGGNGADDLRMHNGLNDADGDLVANYLDLDADNDGIADIVEDGRLDLDSNGGYGGSQADTNGDGWADGVVNAGLQNADLDTFPNFLDLDADNDGLYDLDEERGKRVSLQGRVRVFGDSLNIGWDDDERLYGQQDSDGDGVMDRLDLDADNDGVPDVLETGGSDGSLLDGMLDVLVDQNGDGADDQRMRPDFVNHDRDSLPDHLDLDSDNDGLVDYREAGGSGPDGIATAPMSPNNNPDGWTDVDPLPKLRNSDSDLLPDRIDLDSDNDGIYDLWEFAPVAMLDSLDHLIDGRLDSLQGFDRMTWDSILATFPIKDTDKDGFADCVDLDSDNDGLADIYEDRFSWPDNLIGSFSSIVDPDSNGADNSRMNLFRKDRDGDNVPDFRDLDSDQDGIADVVEAGYNDWGQKGGVHDGQVDMPINGRGWVDSPRDGVEDQDGDSIPGHLDRDSDNDGIPDVIECDGIYPRDSGFLVEIVDTTGGADGWDDLHAGKEPLNTDVMDAHDFLDLDSDNDGITDCLESNAYAKDEDENGVMDNLVLLSNGFGWDSIHGTGSPMNTDHKDLPDYRDDDSDGDNIDDLLEYQNVIEGHGCAKAGFPPDWRNPVPCAVFYEGFSPNGDDDNEFFEFDGIDYYGPMREFTVYNRWGMVVYKEVHWDGKWNGRCNQGIGTDGLEAPVGVYYFTFEYGGNSPHTGWFYLKR